MEQSTLTFAHQKATVPTALGVSPRPGRTTAALGLRAFGGLFLLQAFTRSQKSISLRHLVV